jgi:hypothetical protein
MGDTVRLSRRVMWFDFVSFPRILEDMVLKFTERSKKTS